MRGWDELLTLRVVRRLGEIVNRRWRLSVGFVDAAGRPVSGPEAATFDLPRPLCDLLRADPAGKASCAATPGLLMEVFAGRIDGRGNVDRDPVNWRCHAGLRLVAAPVVLDGELVGAVYAAGHLSPAGRGQAGEVNVTRFGFPDDRVTPALEGTPILGDEACDYLEELMALVVREIHEYEAERARRARYVELLESGGRLRRGFEALVGESEPMKAVYRLVEKVGASDTTVLITGENGTGKELVARAIHARSHRRDGPFVVQNCSAFNDELLDTELFGHHRGAFTGAYTDKKGLFEVADGGTFFLDEIADMSPSLQVKLLRVLQEGNFLPVGSTVPVQVDVRIVAATNRDLKALVESGAFREDLFYRLDVIALHVPPLRERIEDLPALVAHFLEDHARAGRGEKRLTPRAMERMMRYRWPGNVRELENEIERLVVLSEEAPVVDAALLSSRIRGGAAGRVEPAAGKTMPEAVEALERKMIAECLERHGGNRTHAAEELGISRRNLIRKIGAYGLGQRTGKRRSS